MYIDPYVMCGAFPNYTLQSTWDWPAVQIFIKYVWGLMCHCLLMADFSNLFIDRENESNHGAVPTSKTAFWQSRPNAPNSTRAWYMKASTVDTPPKAWACLPEVYWN